MIQEASTIWTCGGIVNSDNWLMRKKGYIFMPFDERCEILEGFAATGETTNVDDRTEPYVRPFEGSSQIILLMAAIAKPTTHQRWMYAKS
jgi:hypothetical protein